MKNIVSKVKAFFAKVIRKDKREDKTENKRKEMNQTDDEIQQYKKKIIRHRKRLIKKIGIALLAVLLAGAIVNVIIEKKVYHRYAVISTSENEDTAATSYVELGGSVLKYGNDGASLVDSKENVVWNQSYEMQNPTVDICNDTAAVIDQKGTLMYILTKDGPVGAVDTALPILKARVAAQGVVVAILEDGEKTWINFYASDGSKIAENQTRVDSPGYPVDIAVSPDGLLIMVTYLYADGATTTSYVAYYNFGTAGQSQIDNIVSGYTYEGILVPQVAYLKEGLSLAYREDGFTIYEGKQIPKEKIDVKVDKEIVSTFYDDSHIGMVFKSDGEDEKKKYTMEVYNTAGKKLFTKNFGIEYKNIKISNNMIVLSNDAQVCLISLKGVEKFNGTVDEGNIRNIFKVGINRYMLISDKGISTIKFK